MSRRRRLVVALVALAASLPLTRELAAAQTSTVPRTNIVMAHSRGWAVDPADDYRRLTAAEYDAHIDAIARDLEVFCADRRAKEPNAPCRILFFIHGGMNTRDGSVNRAVRLHQRIKDDGVYPIFLNWRSSFPSSWGDHLAKVRKGLWNDKNTVLAPWIFVADEVRALPEAPAAWVAEGRHAATRIGPDNAAVKAYVDLLKTPEGLHLNDLTTASGGLVDNRRNWWEKNRAWLALPVTLPFKLVSAPFIIQPWGSGAWDVMLRRTDMVFRTEEAFRGSGSAGDAQSGDASTGAAFAHFLTRFQDEMMPRLCGTAPPVTAKHEDTPRGLNTRVTQVDGVENCADRVRLSIVGHSMGTIILNEALRHVPRLEVANIVYMAAATSVRDYRDTVLPYLRAHPSSQMFHLVLHPQAEVKERGVLDLPPRGSLLVWIDNYFSNPVSPLDRTAGRFFNLAQELRFTDDDVRDRVHLKVFRVGRDTKCWNPQKHSDFGDFPYWDRNFWDPAQPAAPGGPARWLDKTCDAGRPAAAPPQ